MSVVSDSMTEPDAPMPVGSPHVATDNSEYLSRAFEKNLAEIIQTRAEKYAVIQAIKRLKINDYSKIRFVEDYTGFKVQ